MPPKKNIVEQTPSTADSFSLFMYEISRHPLLSPEEEVEKHRVYQKGVKARVELGLREFMGVEEDENDPEFIMLEAQAHDGEDAFNEFVASNLRLVVSIAKRYFYLAESNNFEPLDLIQDGIIGLHRAVEKFDTDKGFKFSTYATWWIRQAVVRSLAEYRSVRLPTHIAQLLPVIWAEAARLGKDKIDREVVDNLSIKMNDETIEAVNITSTVASLDKPLSTDSDLTLGTMIPSEGDDYAGQIDIPEWRRNTLNKIIDIIRQTFPEGYEEYMKFFMAKTGMDIGVIRTKKELMAELGLTDSQFRTRWYEIRTAIRQTVADSGVSYSEYFGL